MPYRINDGISKNTNLFPVFLRIFHFCHHFSLFFLVISYDFSERHSFIVFFFKISLKFSYNSLGFLRIFSEIPQTYLHPPVEQEIYTHCFSIYFVYSRGGLADFEVSAFHHFWGPNFIGSLYFFLYNFYYWNIASMVEVGVRSMVNFLVS